MKKPRFKVGDILTFIEKPEKGYFYGGKNVGGYKAVVVRVEGLNGIRDCYDLHLLMQRKEQVLTNLDSSMFGNWNMLEDEFEEYHNPHISELEEIRKFLYDEEG